MSEQYRQKRDVAREIVRIVEENGADIAMRVTPEGHVERLGTDRRIEFTFKYRGFLFAVRAEPIASGCSVRVHANLGQLPFSIESADDRANALAIVDAAVTALGGRMRIDAGQSILLLEDFELDGPFELATVMSKTVELLVDSKPYLELLSVVVKPPAFRRPKA